MLFNSSLAIYCFQLALGIAQLYMVTRLVYTITKDRLQAFYFTVGFAGLFSGAAFYLDLYGFGDAFAYTFMTAALFFRKPSLIFLSVFLAALVDERALLNTSYIVLFHWIIANQHDARSLIDRWPPIPPQVWAVVTSGFVYLAIRFYLTIHFQLKTPYGGPSPFFYVREASKFFGIRLWTGFESFWILIMLMLFSLYQRRYTSPNAYRLLVILSFLLGITVLTFLLQGDHTRTAAYAFPILFISMIILPQELSQQELRSTLFIISTLSLIFFPIYY